MERRERPRIAHSAMGDKCSCGSTKPWLEHQAELREFYEAMRAYQKERDERRIDLMQVGDDRV